MMPASDTPRINIAKLGNESRQGPSGLSNSTSVRLRLISAVDFVLILGTLHSAYEYSQQGTSGYSQSDKALLAQVATTPTLKPIIDARNACAPRQGCGR